LKAQVSIIISTLYLLFSCSFCCFTYTVSPKEGADPILTTNPLDISRQISRYITDENNSLSIARRRQQIQAAVDVKGEKSSKDSLFSILPEGGTELSRFPYCGVYSVRLLRENNSSTSGTSFARTSNSENWFSFVW